MRKISWLIICTLLFILGCSSAAENPIAVPEPAPCITTSNHYNWGLWQFVVNPEEANLDIIQLRSGEMHLNALTFLEPPPLVNLTLESPLQFTGNILDVDIGLRHPYLGLKEFTGFDVCGIFITSGSVTGFSDTSIRMAGEGDTRLLNPDGYTRWWNPTEFPNDKTIFSYKDGLLGTTNSVAQFSSTLNAYKYFCDELTDPNMPLSGMDAESRCFFSTGAKNIRHYTIELGGGLIFNYAVDASWQFPTGPKPWDVPDDFPPSANRPEAWNASITEIENTLYNDGTNSGVDLNCQ